MDKTTLWRSLAAAMGALGLVFAAISGGLAAARPDYPFWTGTPMIVAYAFFLVAAICFVAVIRRFSFPFVRETAEEKKRRIGAMPSHPEVRRAARNEMKAMGIWPPWWKRLWERLRR